MIIRAKRQTRLVNKAAYRKPEILKRALITEVKQMGGTLENL